MAIAKNAVRYKDPDARKPYGFDWSAFLEGGDTITGSEWIVPPGLTAENESHTTTATKVWLSGGVPGARYKVTNRVVTASGIIDDCTLTLYVQQQ